MITLNTLPSLGHKTRKRVGRGPGSGMGKTSCKGGKGQTARAGVGIGVFEGGQCPVYRRTPKRGQVKTMRNRLWQAIQVGQLANYGSTIDFDTLKSRRLIKANQRLVIIGNDELNDAVHVSAHRITASAKRAIENAKGSWTILP